MIIPHKTIFNFISGNREVQIYLLIIAVMVFLIILILRTLSVYNFMNKQDDDDLDFTETDLIIERYQYSKNNEMIVYPEGCRFRRSGVFVSGYLNNILRISCSKDANDRVLYIECVGNGNRLIKESVHCGVMDYFEYMRVKDLLLKYVQI